MVYIFFPFVYYYYHYYYCCCCLFPLICINIVYNESMSSPIIGVACWTQDTIKPNKKITNYTNLRICRGEQEVIVLSSQLSSETTIILNTWDDCDPQSYNLPHTPPSILDTLNESQMQGKCLDPQLKKRLKLSNAGISLAVDNNGDLSLFLQNSIGR